MPERPPAMDCSTITFKKNVSGHLAFLMHIFDLALSFPGFLDVVAGGNIGLGERNR